MSDRVAQSHRLARIAAQWFDLAFDALGEGRKQDATVGRLAHAMAVAAHENLSNNLMGGGATR